MSWKILSSSVTGSSHIKRNEQGQDYSRAGVVQLAESEYFIGLAADGAGSTKNGGTGAEIACETAYAAILETLRQNHDLSVITESGIREWVRSARNAINDRAERTDLPLRDYACTLIGAIAGDNHALFFQIGDGAAVITEGDGYQAVFWPDQGEYANTTFFVSDENFSERLRIAHKDSSPAEIALFTDGLQNLVLSFSGRTAHTGFFRPLFSALKKNPDNAFTDLSCHLRQLLSSDDINNRSDDDKTLVLAVRIPAKP
jgi:hypothetical protein